MPNFLNYSVFLVNSFSHGNFLFQKKKKEKEEKKNAGTSRLNYLYSKSFYRILVTDIRNTVLLFFIYIYNPTSLYYMNIC